MILGESKLCIQCIEYLLNDDHWELIAIVSQDPIVIQWCNQHSVLVLPFARLDEIHDTEFYLFSVVNFNIIPESFFKQNKIILALNYHDSLLPRYAGLNSTTWAIVENEKIHGVSLHCISSEIDAGDIILQAEIPIEKNETAISLNLKCSEKLLLLFQEAIHQINAGTIATFKQDRVHRTYYGLEYIPENYALMNGIKDFSFLDRLRRGLTFGEGYSNSVASLKIFLHDRFYILSDPKPSVWTAEKFEKNAKESLFNTILDIYGHKTNVHITFKELLPAYNLSQEDLLYLSQLKALEPKQKQSISDYLNEEASLSILDPVMNRDALEIYTKEIMLPDAMEPETALAIVYVVLTRFFEEDFIFSVYNFDGTIPDSLKNLIEKRCFIKASREKLTETFAELKESVKKMKDDAYLLVKDFGYRYHLSLLTDIAVTLNRKDEYIDKHKIKINVESHSLTIEGRNEYALQMSSIGNCLEVLFCKYLKNNFLGENLRTIQLLSDAEYQKIVYEWNKTEVDCPDNKTLHQLFEEQVKRTPNNIAVVYQDRQLSYSELNAKANQLARYISRIHPISPDNFIALCLDRSEYLIISILAVLKCGAAYVPIDPNYPVNRIRYILEDAKPALVLTNERHNASLKNIKSGLLLVNVDSPENSNRIPKEKTDNLNTQVTSTHLAYVIYTSGTTGQPKGVLQNHGNVVSLFHATENLYQFDTQDVWTLFHSYVFDVSIWEIWGAFIYGGKLIVPSYEQIKDLEDFYELCCRFNITVLNQTPSVFYQFSEIIFKRQGASLKKLRYIIFAGEKLDLMQLKSWFHHFPSNNPKLVNMYGITETTIHTTYKIIKKEELSNKSLIGRCLPDKKGYVLDADLNILPTGAIGILYVGGSGITRGYLNQLDLTHRKIIPNLFQTLDEKHHHKNAFLYDSGDKVCYLPNGELEYIGRNDTQVKIRGFRIELAEIEAIINSCSGIQQSIVLMKELQAGLGGQASKKYLISYYTAEFELEKKAILEHIAQYLPDYMIPTALMYLKKFPLTINGKLDYRALPDIFLTNSATYVAPRNELELNLCAVFANVLGLDKNKIGIKDNFFNLGGDSIFAIKVVTQLNSLYQLKLQVNDIFTYKTVELLAAVLETDNSFQNESIQNSNYQKFSLISDAFNLIDDAVEDVYPASYLQMGMIFESTRDNHQGTYHDVFCYTIESIFNHEKFISIWNKLVAKHELLRAKFVPSSYGYNVVIAKKNLVQVQAFEERNSLDILAEEKLRDINQNETGLYRLIVNKKKQRFDFIFSFHHAIVDGWSVASLVNEFIQAYVFDKDVIHDLSNISYGEFIQNERKAIQDQTKFQFWKDYLADFQVPRFGWKVENESSGRGTFNVRRELSQKEVNKLYSLANEYAVSVDTIFLEAYFRTLAQFSDQEDIIVGLVVNNRLEREGGDRLIGLFLNTIPFRVKVNSALSAKVIFNEKINLYKYKDLPYGCIKSIFKDKIYDFAFNFTHFHSLTDSYPYISNFVAFERTSISALLNVYQKENAFTLLLAAHSDYINQTYLDYFMSYYQFNLNLILDGSPDKTILTQEDYIKLTRTWNATTAPYSENKTIQQLFEEQALKTPNKTAVVYENRAFTYQELNELSNQLAHFIKTQYKLCLEDLVILFLERSEAILLAILAVFKAGAAYVPIGTDYPKDRIQYILEDTKARLILSDDRNISKLEHIKPSTQNISSVLSLDNFYKNLKHTDFSRANLQTELTSKHLAYVMYTSGTTGYPKGVMVEHKSIVNIIQQLASLYDVNLGDRISAFCAYTFDVSVSEFFAPLIIGATVYILPEFLRREVEELSLYIRTHKINHLYLPPVLLALLPRVNYPDLRRIIYAGEACDQKTGAYWSRHFELFNYYGPTETTIYAIGKQVIEGDVQLIGKPLNNYKVYVLGKNLNLLPCGAIGELYISGVGLARGYLNQPALTQETFIANPFASAENNAHDDRLYKTGDLVRFTLNGDIHYLGRVDKQVKIRGYRIELSEIESVINRHANIKQSLVILEEDHRSDIENTDKYLIAYYVKEIKGTGSDPTDFVKNWQEIYDLTYRGLDREDLKNNFVGWNSSYTGTPISKAQMCEWRDEIVTKLRQLVLKRVLEIGCGNGLILFNLIDECKYYRAFDFSASAVQHIQKWVRHFCFADKCEVSLSEASDIVFESLPKDYDTVILNSVAQYFPTLDYLENILIKIIENMKVSGQIFIGDVRDFRLLECFSYSVLRFKQKTVGISDIEYFKIKEKELLISPEYFLYLKHRHSSISYIELLPKLADSVNEMNCYRYDVVLHINKHNMKNVFTVDENNFLKTTNIQETLNMNNEEILYLKYPNIRIYEDYINCQSLYGHDSGEFILEKNKALFNITQLTKIFNEFGYEPKFYLGIVEPLYLNIIACKNKKYAAKTFALDCQDVFLIKKRFSNDPLKNMGLLNNKYTEKLKNYLESQLPNYMLPRYLILLDRIPTNSNGKIDYTSLPKPKFNFSSHYEAPKTELEKQLSEIFSKVLNLSQNKISVCDNFFEIGGNSILAIQLVSMINSKLNYTLKVVDVFSMRTIQNLSNHLSSVKDNSSYIANLNHVYNKLNMFMIHPAFAGSEVYIKLSDQLVDNYSCYGLDNYNLYHSQKITDIQELAHFYLNLIDKVRTETHQENKPYLLLGWSLGGQIALSIASILEQCGYEDIFVILIDTVYPDKMLMDYLSRVGLNELQLNFFREQLRFEPNYLAKIKNNFDCDRYLSSQALNIRLKYTQILLFKAMQKESVFFSKNDRFLKEYIRGLSYNNIDKIIDINKIGLVKLENATHFNILERNEFIKTHISVFMNQMEVFG